MESTAAGTSDQWHHKKRDTDDCACFIDSPHGSATATNSPQRKLGKSHIESEAEEQKKVGGDLTDR